jgi:LacI family transcriptional regulator
MTFYDPYAVQAINVCREHGISVPKQVSILGVDNDGLLCEFANPPLSSIQPDHERAGFLAAKELDALMTRPSHKPRTLVSPVLGVVERESTKPLTPAAHLIRKASQFIHDQTAKGISVTDVAAHLKISRRLADQRFREIEGSSIHRTIEDRRMELAEKALSETNRPLRLIAQESGYKSVKTFEAAFRTAKGPL